MEPIRCHIMKVLETPGGGSANKRVKITLNGEPLAKCVEFHEGEGWAVVYDDPPNPYASVHTVCGVVRLEASPEVRAWYEEHFAA